MLSRQPHNDDPVIRTLPSATPMSTRGPGLVKQLWYCYKALKLPWRRQFLIGADLSGNTFWEFKDALNANRLRRIVKFSRKAHYADVKISRT